VKAQDATSTKEHSQTSGLVTVKDDEPSETSEQATSTPSSRVMMSVADSDVTVIDLPQLETDTNPVHVAKPVISGSNARVPFISGASFSHLRTRFLAGESDIIKFSSLAEARGYEVAEATANVYQVSIKTAQ
jgi:hypothetical protein